MVASMFRFRPFRQMLAATLLLAGCGDMTGLSIQISTWGGDHIGIIITVTGGTVEYDCAMGRIDEPIVLRDGRFDVMGVHWPGMGGPIGVDTTQVPRLARYKGTVRGDRMTLTVTLLDTTEILGPFTLERGRSPSVFKCL